VPENATTVLTVTASDPDLPPQTLTYSLVGGADRDRFTLTGNPSSVVFSGPIDYPGAVDTATFGMNDVGVVVGLVGLPGSPNSLQSGFVFDGSTYSLIQPPSSTASTAGDINDKGVIVGSYSPGVHGYILNNGVITTVDYPGGRNTNLNGINNHDVVAGTYVDSDHKRRGFIFNGADFISVNYPGAIETFVEGISDSGLVVGTYSDGSSSERGFLYDGSAYRSIEVPGATRTIPHGVNSDGAIVGTYFAQGISGAQGFLFDGFEYRTVNHPNSPHTTNLTDITNDWQILGTYQTLDGSGPHHGFTATIARPAAPTLKFKTPPNYEAPTDANGDNGYEVIVQASDGKGGVTTQTIRVTVSPVNDNRPLITSPDAVSVAENTTAVLTVTATDADLPPQAITFSIVGGADQSRFNITSGGVLSFNSPPNFEAPTDSNGDNVYIVIVEATDDSLPGVQAILVTVANVVEPPLPGDYNNNGTVDLADYVLWRNSLGQTGDDLAADGNHNGLIDAGDYDLWRANFGRSPPRTSQATLSKDAAPPTQPDAHAQGLLEPMAMRDSAGMDGASLPRFISHPSTAPRTTIHRPARRTDFAADSPLDHGLIVWLASRSWAVERKPPSEPFQDSANEFIPDQPPSLSEEALELAFAALDGS
jgi:serralysin